jgi:hypothetical protein
MSLESFGIKGLILNFAKCALIYCGPEGVSLELKFCTYTT